MESVEEIIEKVRELISPLFDEQYLHLVDIELRGHRITREISELLDVHEDIIPGSFRLEVSSPGISRPLTRPWQFRKNIGRYLKIKLLESEGKKNIVGLLEAVEDDHIVLNVGKDTQIIPFAAIREAKVEIRW